MTRRGLNLVPTQNLCIDRHEICGLACGPLRLRPRRHVDGFLVDSTRGSCPARYLCMWVVVKIMVPFWVLIIIRHLLFRVPQKSTLILKTTHVGTYQLLQVYVSKVVYGSFRK